MCFNKKGSRNVILFFYLKKYLYLYTMEHLNKVELYGKVVELQNENQNLKQQLFYLNKHNYYGSRN